ncbi:OmpH family outer membrane protein [Roseomonas marmotae]|uniref:OmpH family outer membrane protein n=1 Tax=Roseomonas marmotae TaxID=2768161 RepID=A0ABS3KCB4_9PROT|nr:OmpH family outer membrane protein [Roseomonas marmotae]MBO1074283.1 OmpH family outer membrane protein [Roseomonas marmotae]QTI78037.1 OmpH family outer membrane protein [Roseomonas marmotae]
MARRATVALAAILLSTTWAGGAAMAQQQQDWFVPGQGQGGAQQQRPAQQPPRPAQQRPQQRVVQPNPAPLPPGEQPPAAVIGIVDVPEVQRQSSAFNHVREEIEKRRAKLNDDLQKEQARWRDEQQALAAQRASLSPEDLRTRERDLQDRVQDSQRIFRDRSRSIEQAAQGSLVEIEQALAVVIRQVAASRKVNLVLPRPLVIYNEPPFDLTPEVSAQLNKVLKSVTIAAEDAPPAAAPAGNTGQRTPAQDQQPRRN